MANFLSNFVYDRFVAPALDARLSGDITKDTSAFAVGVLPQATFSLRDTLGQAPDADYNLLYAVYQAHADVSACVALWAGGVTGNGWHIGLLDQDAEPNRPQRKRIDDLTTWLKNPNPTKRFSRLLYELVEHMAVTGDAYLNKVKDSQGHIIELWSVHPATLRIVADEHGAILGYVQRYQGNAQAVSFGAEEISRLQLPSVVNDLYGHSPLESVLGEVNLDLNALVANRAIFQNGFKPSVIMLLKNDVKEAADRISALIKQKHTGANHQHGIMTVSGVEKIEPYAQTLKDMEFSALRELTTQKVATAYRVPKYMLNLKGNNDLATAAKQEKQFYNGTIKPLQDIIAEVLTEEVIHTFDPELAFYINEPDFNDADQMRKDALVAASKGIIDDNEMRTRYFSLPPKTPEQLAAEEEARQALAAQMQAKKPQPGATQDKPDEEAGTEATDAPAKKSVVKALSSDDIEAIRQRRETIHDQLEAAIQPKVVTFFERQEVRYLDKLSSTFPAAKSVEKSVLDSLVSSLFDGSDPDDHDLAILLYGELAPSLNAGANEAQLQISFSMDAAAQAKIVDDYLLQNALQHVKGINDTTKSQLTDTLRAGIAAGEGIPDLRNRVKSVFTQATNARANTIARTETAQAFEYANQRAMVESGVVIGKRWLTAQDERTEALCFALEGVTVPVDQAFPGNVEPGFIHPNCRCTSIGVIEGNYSL